jgi:hypothetical protein
MQVSQTAQRHPSRLAQLSQTYGRSSISTPTSHISSRRGSHTDHKNTAYKIVETFDAPKRGRPAKRLPDPHTIAKPSYPKKPKATKKQARKQKITVKFKNFDDKNFPSPGKYDNTELDFVSIEEEDADGDVLMVGSKFEYTGPVNPTTEDFEEWLSNRVDGNLIVSDAEAHEFRIRKDRVFRLSDKFSRMIKRRKTEIGQIMMIKLDDRTAIVQAVLYFGSYGVIEMNSKYQKWWDKEADFNYWDTKGAMECGFAVDVG